MTYNPNIPLPTTSFADWQIAISQNFTSLNDSFAKDHIALDSATTPGNHAVITLPEQEDGPQTGVTEMSMFSKDVVGQTDQIFLKYGSGQEFQFTNWQIYEIPALPNQTTYFSFLPGGLLCQFGLFHNVTGINRTTLEIRPPVIKNLVTAVFTPKSSTVLGGGQWSPKASQIAANGYVTGLQLRGQTIGGPGNLGRPETSPQDFYYFLVGNT